jgi:hypothetical protein
VGVDATAAEELVIEIKFYGRVDGGDDIEDLFLLAGSRGRMGADGGRDLDGFGGDFGAAVVTLEDDDVEVGHCI